MKNGRILVFALIAVVFLMTGTAYAQDGGDPPTVGMLFWHGNQTFYDEMARLGYVNGVNINFMEISYEGVEFEDYQAHTEQQSQAMIDSGLVDVFVVNTDSDAVALQAQVGNTPIVFARSDDPVATGAVASLITPGGNITGVVTNKHHERRLQLLTEILPSTDMVYYLYSPLTMEAETVLAGVRAVGAQLNVEVIAAPTPDAAAGLEALANTPEGVDWLFLTPYVPFDLEFMEGVIATSLEHKIGVAAITNDPVQGYLVGYGPSIAVTDQQAAQVVDRILRGASPANLPVQIAENFLTVNLEAAEAIGLEVPLGVLRQAETIVRPGYFDDLPQFGETTE
jgi:putative ABC transport system substrate-binding protein